MQATNDFIIVKNSMQKEQKTASGLILKREDTSAENNGVIVSVGESVQNTSYKVGDTVWFSSVECRVGEEDRKLVAIKEKNIIAVGE